MNGKAELTDEELESMLEEQSKLKEKPKHRGYGDYERRGIYRGASVKKDENEKTDSS